jgi:hypothetical protein
MNKDKCNSIRERLAGDGVEATVPPEVASHLEGCADCTSFLEALRRVDSALGDMAVPDATDTLAAKTLDAVRRAARDDGEDGDGANGGSLWARPGDRDRWFAAGLAASVLIATGVGLNSGFDMPSLWAEANRRPMIAYLDVSGEFAKVETQAAGGPVSEMEPSASWREDAVRSKSDAGASVAGLPADKKGDTGDYALRGGAGGIAGGPVVAETEEDSGLERDIIALLDEEDRPRRRGKI